MDVRVFPFAFPPIKGGAQGGVSPTPTPPPVINVYDFSNAKLECVFRTENGDWKTASGYQYGASLKIRDIVPLDVTDVASLGILTGFSSITADGVEMKDDADFSKVVILSTYTGIDVGLTETTTYFRAGMESDNWNTKMAGKAAGGQAFVTITAYDNNGNILQTKTWTAVVA